MWHFSCSITHTRVPRNEGGQSPNAHAKIINASSLVSIIEAIVGDQVEPRQLISAVLSAGTGKLSIPSFFFNLLMLYT